MASNFTCPLPSNINPLSSNGFNFSIKKLPAVSFFCQEVNLPGITLQILDFDTPLSTLPVASDKLFFDDLVIQFIVDQNMENYKAVYNWMIGLGFDESYQQYSDFINTQEGFTRMSRESSDAVLQILGSNNQPVQSIQFIDIVPTSLSSMNFESTVTDVTYIVGTATFKIARYNFID